MGVSMMTREKTMKKRLRFLYGRERGDAAWNRLKILIDKYRGSIPQEPFELTERDVVLITYADALKERDKRPLETLRTFFNEYLNGTVTIMHILPFFPYSSDDGFSVIDYKEVNRDLGTWKDIENIGKDVRLMFDLVINHISSKSREFQEFLRGREEYRDFFIALWKGDEYDTSRVVRPRALPLLTQFDTPWGSARLWTTFSQDQIDLNFTNPQLLLFIIDILLFYITKGASIIRLDAIAYLWKKSGTSCIHLRETHTVVKLIRTLFELVAPHVKIITETNVPHEENISYFGNGRDEAHLVYNFALPPLTVHALLSGNATLLSRWARTLKTPGNESHFYNFTASHDGIGVLPAKGILTDAEIGKMVSMVEKRGGKVSHKNNPDGAKSIYELNISLFDLLSDPFSGEPLEKQVARFIASQAIALSLKGIPALYYHSILGSRNYYEGVKKTGMNRSINREKLDPARVSEQLKKQGHIRNLVYHRLTHLITSRSRHRAFHPKGKQRVLDLHPSVFGLERTAPPGLNGERIVSLINVSEKTLEVSLNHGDYQDILTGKAFRNSATLRPFEILWLQQYLQN